jgi:hypothetical protein
MNNLVRLVQRCEIAEQAFDRIINMDGGTPQTIAAGMWASIYAPLLGECAAVLRAAQGTEAGTAETVEQGSVHDGPVAESDAP